MERINAELAGDQGVSFLLRVGINSGEVMAGAVGDRYTVIGDAVNVAARLQAAAGPGPSPSARATYRATREAISYERAGAARPEGQGRAGPGLGGGRGADRGAPTAARCAARRR